MSTVYAAGCARALEKFGYLLTSGAWAKLLHDPAYQTLLKDEFNQQKDTGCAVDRATWRHVAQNVQQAQQARGWKQGSMRIPAVPDDDAQTPQEPHESVANASLQQHTVEDLWDQHDKRKQLFTAGGHPD